MRICKCGTIIPSDVKINGHSQKSTSRTSSYVCVPYNTSPYSRRYSKEERSTQEPQRAKKASSQNSYSQTLKEFTGTTFQTVVRSERKGHIIRSVGGCQICGYNRIQRNLAFHHLNDKEKEFDISQREFSFAGQRIINEVRKCILLCHNCHGEVHDNFHDIVYLEGLNRYLQERITLDFQMPSINDIKLKIMWRKLNQL